MFDLPIAITTWVFFALLKLIMGILIIAWQMLAKPILQTLLLPLFCISPVHLLHRCHYTPTVEYLHGPPHTLHTMPSMIQSWIFGCSEGPSRMFRRSKSDVPKVQDVPKVPVGCSEGPSRMFRRSQSDVWKVRVGCLEGPSRMFGSPRCLEVPVGCSEIVGRWDCHLTYIHVHYVKCLSISTRR